MQNLDPRRARWIKVRMGLLCGFMGVGLGLIVSSAVSVQLEDGPEWREMAEKQGSAVNDALKAGREAMQRERDRLGGETHS